MPRTENVLTKLDIKPLSDAFRHMGENDKTEILIIVLGNMSDPSHGPRIAGNEGTLSLGDVENKARSHLI